MTLRKYGREEIIEYYRPKLMKLYKGDSCASYIFQDHDRVIQLKEIGILAQENNHPKYSLSDYTLKVLGLTRKTEEDNLNEQSNRNLVYVFQSEIEEIRDGEGIKGNFGVVLRRKLYRQGILKRGLGGPTLTQFTIDELENIRKMELIA